MLYSELDAMLPTEIDQNECSPSPLLKRKQRYQNNYPQRLKHKSGDHTETLITLLFICFQWLFAGHSIFWSQPGSKDLIKWFAGVFFELSAGIYFTVYWWKRQQIQEREEQDAIQDIMLALSGPLALIVDLYSFFFINGCISFTGALLRVSCKTLTLPFAQASIKSIMRVLPSVTNFFMTISVVFYGCTYIAACLYGGLFVQQKYFDGVANSALTMLQIMTLDGWGPIGREIYAQTNIVQALYLCAFILGLSYVLYNMLIGLILESLGHTHNSSLEITPAQTAIMEKNDNELYFKGSLYQRLVLVLTLVTQLDAILNTTDYAKLMCISNFKTVCINLSISLIYTAHYLALTCNLQRLGDRFISQAQNERKSKIMMVIHLLAGPLSLAADFFQIFLGPVIIKTDSCVGLGIVFKLLKIFTIPALKNVVMGISQTLRVLWPPLVAIGGLLCIFSLWALTSLRIEYHFWYNFNASFYTFIQLLTLDDWCAKILPEFIRVSDSKYAEALFLLFIIIANYFFLNILIAFSSINFKVVTLDDLDDSTNIGQDFFIQGSNSLVEKEKEKSSQEWLKDYLQIMRHKQTSERRFATILSRIEEIVKNEDEEQLKDTEVWTGGSNENYSTENNLFQTISYKETTIYLTQSEAEKLVKQNKFNP